MNTKQIIEKAISLPIEERAIIVDSLLRSFNQIEDEIEREWINEAKKRLNELKSHKVEAISGKDVFNRVWKRFEK